MNTKDLKGSPYRDAIKHWHKTLPNDLYACDIDLVLVSFGNSTIKAILDVKSPNDNQLSNTHKQLYNWFVVQEIPVFLITVESFERIKCDHCDNYEIIIDVDSDVTITEYGTGESCIMTRGEYINWERGWRE